MRLRSSVTPQPLGDLSDDELVLRFRAGDEQAFAVLYERYVERIYGFIARLLRDRDVAADVTQEVFVKALGVLRARTVQGSVRSWLFTIARNAAIDYQRRQRTWRLPYQRFEEEESRWEAELVASDQEADPETAAHRAEMVEVVWEAARALPPNDYAVLELVLRHELSPAEVARVVGVRRGAVNTRLSRARDALVDNITVLLFLRQKEQPCGELARLLGGVDLRAGLTAATRRAVLRHIEQCATCQEARRKIRAADLLPVFAPVPLAPELRKALWQAVDQAMTATTLPAPTPSSLRHWFTSTSLGRMVLGLLVGLGVFVVGATGFRQWGTIPVVVETRACPPLKLELDRFGWPVARYLGVPAQLIPKTPTVLRLPLDSVVRGASKDSVDLELLGVPVHIRVLVPLESVNWNGAEILGQGSIRLTGDEQYIQLVCQKL